MKLGLKNCQDLDSLLAFPSQAFPAIHIAGTNGKGSISAKIAAAHQAAGLKTGLYTSPHISCFRERIRINGQLIEEKQAQVHLNTLFALCRQHHIKATFFELATMLAFLHFASEKVDIAVLETGLGGRLDATNISKPVLSIITSISLDHTETLGTTIEAITKEKAGIIKPAIPILVGPTVQKAIIDPIAAKHGSPCFQVNGLFEDFHAENSAIAGKALERLDLPRKAIEMGIKALPPCRLETFTKADLTRLGHQLPLPEAVILDVAHNPDGLSQLLKAIRKRYHKHPLRFVIGLSSNKDVEGCLQAIKNEASTYHLVEGDNNRAVPKEILANALARLGIGFDKLLCEKSISAAISHATQVAGEKNELVIVCGTFFIMKGARRALGIIEPQDPTDMNER